MPMKRRKIAAFANGWSDSYLITVLGGIEKCAKENNVDVFVFVDFSSGTDQRDITGELNIQKLPDLRDFDGAIMMSNTFNYRSVIYDLQKRIEEVGIPCVTLEYEIDGVDFFGTENTTGMMELTNHLIEIHNVKDVVVLSGQEDNKESIERVAAVEKAMANHGLSLPKDQIMVGDFSDMTAYNRFKLWHEKNNRLPDAVICANDIMALGILDYANSIGVKVPEDLIVTGYDHIEQAVSCTPAITTVARDWNKLGYHALMHVLDKIDNKPVKMRTMMQTKLVVAESCGCHVEIPEKIVDIQHCAYSSKKTSMDFDSHNRALYMYLRDAKNIDDVYVALSDFLARNNIYEGKTCGVCLVDEFFTSLERGSLPVNGYGEEVHVVADVKNNKAGAYKKMPSTQILPWSNEEGSEGHFYVIVPLHSDEQCMGYAYFEDNVYVCDNYILYTWTRHVNQYLEQVRSNMRLELLNEKLRILSVTDALTGIYNRMGYKEFAIPYLENNRKNGKNTALMIADINHMKAINDQYGHTQGDLAIMVVAKALKKALPDWILVRYGGDEYLLVGDCDTKEGLRKIRHQINDALEQEKTAAKLDYRLSVSVGGVIIEQSSTLSVEDCFKKADRSMYRIKKRHHKAEDKTDK